MQVKAIMTGYYDHKRRRAGDIFTIENEKQFSKKWMERLDSVPSEMRASKSRKAAKVEAPAEEASDAESEVI